MKKNIFLYLFIFSLLINVFTYMYFTNKMKFETTRIENLEIKANSLKDSLKMDVDKLYDANYFTLGQNDNAQEYFAGMDIEKIQIAVRDAIYSGNGKAGGNPLINYPQIEGRPFTINNYRILNNRWVIVDFSNGKVYGESILKYFVEDDGSITFETAESLLHANTFN
ncbi:hydrolase [Flavobacterium alkalisoli]|uniref:Hydrolase n=1 Tax=Flavobacterium alkalisoli TaxID=2602769 RepID=A0A5B9FX50_9FLAO|nr:hydrolase [Flavobacterium alkalisoli]QEE50879.1 hydrolase [Flavobacterium alkalisoli]